MLMEMCAGDEVQKLDNCLLSYPQWDILETIMCENSLFNYVHD